MLEGLWNFKSYFAFLHLFVSEHMHLTNSAVLVEKNPPADAGDAGVIPGLGRSPGGGNGTHSSILAWRIPRTGSLAGYSPWGRTELDTTERLNIRTRSLCMFSLNSMFSS